MMANQKYSIKDLQKYAEGKNGKLISDKYINCHTKYKWECNICGYVWKNSWGRVLKRGQWCPSCAGNLRKNLQDMQKIAESKRGECLSKKYINMHTKLKWQCSQGHMWEAVPSGIFYGGSWCPQCSTIVGAEKRRTSIDTLKKFAKSKNGELLSQKYKTARTNYQWKCHVCGYCWSANWNNVKDKKQWCPSCAGNIKKTVKDMHVLAKRMGGEFLSDKYINMNTKLKWCCSEGHVFEAQPNHVQSGHWCPECMKVRLADINRKYNIEDLKQHAKSLRGECLSDIYSSNNQKYLWKCSKNHIWETTWASVLDSNSWCPTCANEVIAQKLRKYTIEDAQKLAKNNNGECLSDKFISTGQNLTWKCQKNHVWAASFYSVQKKKTWCPYCANIFPKTIEDMQKVAELRRGKCLSTEYVNNNTKLRWQCEYGHVWEVKYSSIQSGTWCPYCMYKSEQKFREVIEKTLNAEFPKKHPSWLINDNGNRLELDGYNDELGIAFEYQGEQHFRQVSYLKDTKEVFAKRQKHDQIKKELCAQYGIILLCPTYELGEDEFEEHIKNELNF